jgi:hypothetical protein
VVALQVPGHRRHGQLVQHRGRQQQRPPLLRQGQQRQWRQLVGQRPRVVMCVVVV